MFCTIHLNFHVLTKLSEKLIKLFLDLQEINRFLLFQVVQLNNFISNPPSSGIKFLSNSFQICISISVSNYVHGFIDEPMLRVLHTHTHTSCRSSVSYGWKINPRVFAKFLRAFGNFEMSLREQSPLITAEFLNAF